MNRVSPLLGGMLSLVVGACAAPHARAVNTSPAPVASTPASKASATSGRRPPVVPAERRPVVHTYFGTAVTDDYEWLEDGDSAEVKAFVDAQNALARAKLDAIPERGAVHDRVAAILKATSPDWFDVRLEGGRLFALEEAPPKQQRILVSFAAPAGGKGIDVSTKRVVLDPNELDASGKTTIDFYAPAPDARIVAVSLSKDGTESGDLHLIDVATGKDRNETIARVNGGTAGGSVAWNGDGTGLFYTRYPRTGERPPADLDFYQEVWFHKLGAKEDAVSIGGKDLPRIAESVLQGSDDGKRVLLTVSNGDGGETELHVREGERWVRLSRFEEQLKAATFGPEGRIYAVARKGAPRGKVVVFTPPYDRPPTDFLPESDGVIADLFASRDALYTLEIVDGPSRMRRFPLVMKSEPLAREPETKPKKPPPPPTTITPGARGPSAAVLPLPAVSSVAGVSRIGDDLLVRIESYTHAPRWMLYRASEHRFVATALAKKAAFDMSDTEVVRESCISKDGTRVPMTVLRKRGTTKLDGSSPALLTGYGGFGISVRPRMRPSFRVWLDHGGVVAEANLRGGGERGEEWQRAGKRTKKQNVFDDFAACAGALVSLGYTKPERLAITGRSNGGLLMGAEIVQHPNMFRAVASAVGIYDMLRNELTPNGAFNVTEYGSVKNVAEFRALHAYSPFHNVKDDVAYPAILFTTGANDPRVAPHHSRKMVARLQAATSSDRPILLLASHDTGHGRGTPLATEIEETTDVLAFLLHEVSN